MKNKYSRKRSNQGAENLIGFIIAVGVFTIALTIILASMRSSVSPNNGAADLKSKANQVMTVISSTPGVPEDWYVNPDYGGTQISRFGLTQSSTSATLSGYKFVAMTASDLSSNATNRKLDYEEAKAALGLDGYDFHIRTYPVFEDTTTGYGTVMASDIRVAYIGNYGTVANPPSILWDIMEMPESAEESATIATLGTTFTNALYIPPLIRLPPLPPILERAGDKFADDSTYIQNNLVPRLASGYYQILVVGSNVGQTALTPAATKSAIESWVQAGGKLIVLGGEANTNWLEPFLATGTRGATGSPYAPDTAHPVLSIPNILSYMTYTDSGNVWPVPLETYSHIVTKGPGQQDLMNDILAMANEGAVTDKGETIFGEGTLFLTTFLPYQISNQLGREEASKFLANVFMYVAEHDVYLDYGPRIPDGASIATAERLTTVYFDKFGSMEIYIMLYIWKS